MTISPKRRKRLGRTPRADDARYTKLFTMRLDEDRMEVVDSMASIEDVSESEVVREAISLLAMLYTATKGEANREQRKRVLAAALAHVTKEKA